MGQGYHIFGAEHFVRGEVRGVGGALAGLQRRQQGGGVHQLAPGKVQQPHTVPHLIEGMGVYHALGLGGGRQVQGDIVAVLVYLVQGHGAVHRAGEPPGGVH